MCGPAAADPTGGAQRARDPHCSGGGGTGGGTSFGGGGQPAAHRPPSAARLGLAATPSGPYMCILVSSYLCVVFLP